MRYTRWVWLLLVPAACVLTSCAAEMRKSELQREVFKYNVETVNHLWYIGSADGFDYFIHGTASSSRKIKVKEGELVISARFPLTNAKTRWLLVKGDADFFLRDNPPELDLPPAKGQAPKK